MKRKKFEEQFHKLFFDVVNEIENLMNDNGITHIDLRQCQPTIKLLGYSPNVEEKCLLDVLDIYRLPKESGEEFSEDIVVEYETIVNVVCKGYDDDGIYFCDNYMQKIPGPCIIQNSLIIPLYEEIYFLIQEMKGEKTESK